jgi:hypothetical protein
VTPDPGLSFGLYQPLVFAAGLYAVLLIAGAILESRGNDLAEAARSAAFVCILAAGGYAVVLAIIAIASKLAVIDDFLYITLIVIAFFALIGGVGLLVEMLLGTFGRGRRRGS